MSRRSHFSFPFMFSHTQLKFYWLALLFSIETICIQRVTSTAILSNVFGHSCRGSHGNRSLRDLPSLVKVLFRVALLYLLFFSTDSLQLRGNLIFYIYLLVFIWQSTMNLYLCRQQGTVKIHAYFHKVSNEIPCTSALTRRNKRPF